MDEVINAEAKKQNNYIEKDNAYLVYKAKLGNYDVDLMYSFISGKLIGGMYTYSSDNPAKIDEFMEFIKSELTKKYGEGAQEEELFKSWVWKKDDTKIIVDNPLGTAVIVTYAST
ncbi:hypothetical protein [Paenibacillus sp. J22TS3]|uniref:hypothetical protein n=1 Tax=Paenibacillus sp. J22TS3 TaxID=2807192 RepID=UPI001AFD1DFF|nr:hypothetical protein [Paenibacillus sp. J22TS3]GIP22678.1 hypothetical protein J22TS3_29530 [Paenibacillus sp. J22TS3]